MHPFFLLELLQRLVGLAGGRVHQVLGEPGRPAPSMALRARRSRGCRAASGRRRRSAREIPLITSPSPGVLTVAASGVSTLGRSSAAAHSEQPSRGCEPGGSTGWGRAGAEPARSGLGAAVPTGERRASWGPAEAHLG